MSNLNLPLISLRGMVVFPEETVNFDVGRKESINAVKDAVNNGKTVLLCSQIDSFKEELSLSNLYKVGTVAKILQMTKISNDYYRVIAKGLFKAKVVDVAENNNCLYCFAEPVETLKYENDPEVIAYCRALKSKFSEYFNLNNKVSAKAFDAMLASDDSEKLFNIICSNLKCEVKILQQLLEENDQKAKLDLLLSVLNNEIKIFSITKEIEDKTNAEINKHQREYVLKEKIRQIKEELGDDNNTASEIDDYKDKIEKLTINSEYKEKLFSEVKKMSYSSPMSPEYTVVKTYLDTVIGLPWNISSDCNTDINKAIEILDNDHYGLEKVKDKIVDYLSVKINDPDYNGTIICLAGPPGVGKTSIGKSIAKALDRKFVRISLGGMKDESEIRGHRKTYIGSMPGKIISAFNQAKVNNPLILFDEIDKLGSDYKGDPSSAMLEVLDSEQNYEFRDNYIEIPFDLSKAVFITTANEISNIPAPLRDRLEIINIDSYTFNEKVMIAKDFLLKKQLNNHKIENLEISDSAIEKIITSYTRESGVRTLERAIVTICRKAVRNTLISGKKKITITEKNIKKFLGNEKFSDSVIDYSGFSGVSTGMAWTQYGGEILKTEVTVIPGSGKIEITGNLGEVMVESVKVALAYLKAHSDKYKIPFEFASKCDINVHFPEGAVPKDGPSAGITILTALVSAITGKIVRPEIAMTGELTITGKVLPIGGLKEKSLAALRNNYKEIIVPKENKRDVSELPDCVKKDIKIRYADSAEDVIKFAISSVKDKNNKFLENIMNVKEC